MSAELHLQFCFEFHWSAHSAVWWLHVLSAFLIVSHQSHVACLKTKGLTLAGNENAISWRIGLALATFSITKLYSPLSRLLFKGVRRSPFSINISFSINFSFFINISHFDPHWIADPHGHHYSSGSAGKESACHAGGLDSIPGLGRSPGEGNGNPLQCSCLENFPWTEKPGETVHGVTKSGTCLSVNTFTFMWHQ